jgi:hypothetical protein
MHPTVVCKSSLTTQKSEQVNEGLLSRRFRNKPRMAPDMPDVVVAALWAIRWRD